MILVPRRKAERKMVWKMVEIAYTAVDQYPLGVLHYIFPFTSVLIKIRSQKRYRSK